LSDICTFFDGYFTINMVMRELMSRAQPFANDEVCKAVNLLTRESLRFGKANETNGGQGGDGRGLRCGGSILGCADIKPLSERGG
jgi:hypothetical protein